MYADVCDDNDYAARAKADYHEKARAAGVPAITSGGIYPGVSNVMAAHMVSTARREYDKDGHFVGKDGADKADAVEPKKLQYFYYTAGTGVVSVLHNGKHTFGVVQLVLSWVCAWQFCLSRLVCCEHLCTHY